ncbi:MAG: hypothetical protein KAW88_00310 [Candidatus Cloacimonetes bacterium]|nr:hypothetical protein [Candidatus Cloacimonadota bacterium]
MSCGVKNRESLILLCIIYFTDGYSDSFPSSPDYPVLWILTDKASFTPPFGEVIHMG